METFMIQVSGLSFKTIRLKAEVLHRSDQIELIRVSGRNRSIKLRSNRPLLRARGLKNKRIEWKLIEGTMNNAYILESILRELDRYFKQVDKGNIQI